MAFHGASRHAIYPDGFDLVCRSILAHALEFARNDGLGGVIGLWAFLSMGFRNLRAFPEIPQHGWLVVHGPYRWIRHPMYASVLVITLAWTVEHPLSFRMALWVGLVVTLWVKLRYEEGLLMERFPEYDAYRRQTKRLIPFVW